MLTIPVQYHFTVSVNLDTPLLLRPNDNTKYIVVMESILALSISARSTLNVLGNAYPNKIAIQWVQCKRV